jgi:catechol 2,3-dioxygenase-like lactoylglutathione lyase family enzyme
MSIGTDPIRRLIATGPSLRAKESTRVSKWEKEIGAMTLHVADLGRAKKFYEQVFGLPVQHEDEDSVMFRFASMYVFLHSARVADGPPSGAVLESALTGAGQFAIIVDDVDAVTADLEAAGVSLISGPSDRDWGMRTITFADPSGHVWEIAQPIPG